MTAESAIILAVVVVTVLLLPIWNYRHARNGDWHSHGKSQMRRMTKDGWEYRAMTEPEFFENDRHRGY